MTTYVHFFIMYRSLLLRMKNVSDESCRKTRNTHVMFSNFFFLENLIFYEITWKNIVEPCRPQMTIRRKRIACGITKVTNTHTYTHNM
jgi:hypothetical protein